MMSQAHVLTPAKRQYSGVLTKPDRWSTWLPREGDILVCTPPKCGTTWTQTMVAMLIHQTNELPAAIPEMSPWVDVDLGVPAENVAEALGQQRGRRVVKTHTPADGFPIWDGVTVVGVYRHPLDVFFSLRKHNANVSEPDESEPMCWPLEKSFEYFIEEDADVTDFDRDKLATITLHYTETVLSGRLPDLKLFHYADFAMDSRLWCHRSALHCSFQIAAFHYLRGLNGIWPSEMRNDIAFQRAHTSIGLWPGSRRV